MSIALLRYMESRAQLLLLELRLEATADDTSAYVLRLAEPLVQVALVGAQASLRGHEGSRERLLVLEVDILLRGISIRNVAGERVSSALVEIRVAHGLLVLEDRIRHGHHLRLVNAVVAHAIVDRQPVQDVARDLLVRIADALHVLTALVLVGQAHAAAEDLLVLAAVIQRQSLTVHGGEDGALRSILDRQLLVGAQTLLEVVAVLVTVIQRVKLAACRRPIKRIHEGQNERYHR